MPVTCEVVNVTPTIAKEFLLHNKHNRALSQRCINKYAADMRAGEWRLTGETIAFYENGDLKDGQHRLSAVLKAGISVPMIVVRGIDDRVKMHDLGHKRSTRDIMSLEGYEAALKDNCTIGAVNFLLKEYSRLRDTTTAQTMAFVDMHADLLVSSYYAVRDGKSSTLCKKASLCAAAFCELYNGIDPESVCRFFSIANSGFCTSDRDTSAIVLRNFLVSPTQYDSKISIAAGGQYQQKRYFEVCIRAIKDFSCGRPRKRFYADRTETAHERNLKEHAFIGIGVSHAEADMDE